MKGRRGRPRRVSVLILASGLAMLLLYALLSALEVGKVGAPTDIGGGVIALLGYIMTGVGVVLIVRDVLGRRPEEP